MSSSTGIIRRVSNLIPPNVKLKIYYALIYSRITYAITIWGRSLAISKNLCHNALRRAWNVVFFGTNARTPPEKRVMSFDSIFEYCTAVKLYKILLLHNHEYFARNFANLTVEHNYNTRFNASSKFNTPFFSRTKCQNSFIYQSVRIWNSIPLNIREAPSLRNFKTLLKKFLISQQ